MVQSLNKAIAGIFFLFATSLFSQQQNNQQSLSRSTEPDYKDPAAHEKFAKRRQAVSAWQINQLKNGALIVRLKTNQLAISELRKAGNIDLAKEKELETYAINKNTIHAFNDHFKFCKVYFMPSNYSDSLLGGARSGIFLDTNLKISPALSMNENFYLLADRDYGYNSSIGFVPEDSARKVQEKGNAVKQMAFVLKNKYGHQLKNPFPYAVGEKNYMGAIYDQPITYNDATGGPVISYNVNRTYLADLENDKKRGRTGGTGNSVVKLQKQFTYEILAEEVRELNDELFKFHRSTPAPDASKITEDVKPFLY